MKKLSKAQEREFETIKELCTDEELEKSKQYYIKRLADPKEYGWHEWYQEHLDMYNQGFHIWKSPNSRTLEILAERGLIDYIKRERVGGCTPIDWVRVKEAREA